jgi:hypothetical protein
MKYSKVYWRRITSTNRQECSEIGKMLLARLVDDGMVVLEKKLPIKIHSGEPGNVTYLKSDNLSGIIAYLQERNIVTYFTETNTATGPRSQSHNHTQIAIKHGFTNLPFIIADGENGFDHVRVPIKNGQHFAGCLIATKLAEMEQVLVTSHFKGHIMSGFGGAIKQLALGFASGRGKTEIHSKVPIPDDKSIDWSQVRPMINGHFVWNTDVVYADEAFRQRMVEYALAAVNGKSYPYIQYAIDITANCDCDGHTMTPIYRDLGIFASVDPVAIDKACFDELSKREGKTAFPGGDIFPYAKKLGLGSPDYKLIEV